MAQCMFDLAFWGFYKLNALEIFVGSIIGANKTQLI